MDRFTLGTIEKSESNIKWYNRKGYHMTGETITETIKDIDGSNSETTYIIFSGSWTRSGTVRDCGDHFIRTIKLIWLFLDVFPKVGDNVLISVNV